MVAGWRYDKGRTFFAVYRRLGVPPGTPMPAWHEDSAEFRADSLRLYRSLSVGGQKAGTIVIVSDLGLLRAKLKEYGEIAAVVLLMSMVATFLVSLRLLRLITQPSLRLFGLPPPGSPGRDHLRRGVAPRPD